MAKSKKRKKVNHKQVVIDEPGNSQAEEQLKPGDVPIQDEANPQRLAQEDEMLNQDVMDTEIRNQDAIENEANPQQLAQNEMLNQDVMDKETRNEDAVQANDTSVEKKTCRGRGLTKVKRLPSDIMSRVEVDFNAAAKPIGPGAIKLSSYLGSLVREIVPITLTDWRLLSDELKLVLWNSIQARFKLDEEWQKAPIFQQMGCIWRASKSRLVGKILKANTIEERLQLKPDNIRSVKEWKIFIKIKTSSNFKATSEKFKSIRSKQLPHTCGRKGMARIAEELKKECADPSSVSRAQIWIKSRTRKNGEPVNMDVADAIEKVKKIQTESQSSSATTLRDDAIVQVLGQDRPGRVRGMGNGATYTKVMLSQVRDRQTLQFQSRLSKLEEELRILKGNQGNICRGEESTSQTNYGNMLGECDLLDCFGTDEIVAQGIVLSKDPKELVHKIPIGPNAMQVLIELPRKLDAFLWRAAPKMIRIRDAIDMPVVWPADRVRVRVILQPTEQTDKEDNMTSRSGSTNNKCKLYDWTGSNEVVAEGRIICSNPMQLVNDTPLGPCAMLVCIDSSKKSNAYLWRPSAGMQYVEEAVGSKVAWPEEKVVVDKDNASLSPPPLIPTSISPPPLIPTSISPLSAHSTTKNKCVLIDVSGKGIVAEGRVISRNPRDLVHFVPLGKDAVKVSVDVVRIPEAVVYRPTSEFSCIEDALGSMLAWPVANVVEF